MNFDVNLNTIVEGVILSVLLGFGKSQWLCYKSMVKLNEWTKAHDKQDDERHSDLVKRMERVEASK